MSTPQLSVVVPSVNGWSDLHDCLVALRVDATNLGLEILVVDRVGETVRRPIRVEFPEVTLIEVGPATTIPDMRALAIRHATTSLVAIIEDHVLVPNGWGRSIVEAQTRHGGVVGGSVYNVAVDRLVDRAAFFCEYSHLLPPLPAGRTEWLTGNNTLYPRAVLKEHRNVVEAGVWEDQLHRELRKAGVALTYCPDILVAHKKHYSVGEYASQRYYYARSFAGSRVSGRSWSIKIGYGLGALLLPPVLLSRIVARVRRAAGPQRELVESLPLLGLFVSAWSVGEVVGYWFGPGDALARVC